MPGRDVQQGPATRPPHWPGSLTHHIPNLTQPLTTKAHLLVRCLFALGSTLPGERVCLQQVRAVPLHSMSSPALSLPSTPRTVSPMPPDEDHARPLSPLLDEAHTMGALGEIDTARFSPHARHGAHAPPPSLLPEQTTALPKGKEKAATGPLKLLDLPVDILKEIIHQVGTDMRHRAPTVPGRRESLLTRTISTASAY